MQWHVWRDWFHMSSQKIKSQWIPKVQCHQSQHPSADRKNQFIENKSVLLNPFFFDEELKK
jgi:hypothetical protein